MKGSNEYLFPERLLPAVTLTEPDKALFVAEALLEGGIHVMEITFRTSATASAISAVSREFPEMTAGAGTILSKEQLHTAVNAGARFGLSPGFSEPVVAEAARLNFQFIPGVLSPSDIEKALNRDVRLMKLFPVHSLGGAEYVKSLQGPYSAAGIRLIPMGGVNSENLPEYVKHPIVEALGGSWIAPADLIDQDDFRKIRENARSSLASVRESAGQ